MELGVGFAFLVRQKRISIDGDIGLEFYTETGKWCCTDVGTRVIVAIQLNQDDARNYNGPPYSIVETVFDEYDMEGCRHEPYSNSI